MLLDANILKRARDIDLSDLPHTERWERSCHNSPSKHELVMAAIDELLGGSGVEAAGDTSSYPLDIKFEYINMGDTYTPTICYRAGVYILTCWGDMAEKYCV